MSVEVRQDAPALALTLPGGEARELVETAWHARQADRELADELGRPAPSGPSTSAQYLLDLGTGPALPAVSEGKPILAAQAGDQTARARVVEAFLPHIAGIARVYRHSPRIDRLELIQEGVVGLLRALERYDPEWGPFWPFASWWVRQAMQQLVAELTRRVILSDRALRHLARVRDAQQVLQASGRSASLADLAQRSQLPADQVQSLLAIDQPPRSLEESLSDSDGNVTGLSDTAADPDSERDYERVLDAVETHELLALLSGLSERERMILRVRYGLEGEEQTLAQVGARFGLSTERVRQLEQRALAKLRAAARTEVP